jgi:hypothetical protein
MLFYLSTSRIQSRLEFNEEQKTREVGNEIEVPPRIKGKYLLHAFREIGSLCFVQLSFFIQFDQFDAF